MEGNRRRKLIAAVVAVVAVAGGGAAIAATQFGSPKEESQAVINDAAKQLGVQPSALSDALKTALKNWVDAAVAAGALTKAEGDAIKARVDSGEFPLVGAPFGHFENHLGPFGPFAEQASVAAKYLGLTTS